MRPHVLGLRARFSLLIAGGVLLLSAALASISFYESQEALVAAAQEEIFQVAQAQAARLSDELASVSLRAVDLAAVWEARTPASAEEAYAGLTKLVGESPGVFGMAAAFAPGALDPTRHRLCPYVFRSPRGIQRQDLAVGYADYTRADWYQVPALTGRRVWSEPYFDEGGGDVIMTTFSAPMIAGGRLTGVITADLALDKMGQRVARLAVGRTGWAFLISGRGTFLAAPQPEWVMRESLFSLAEGLGRPDLRALGRLMIRGAAGVERLDSWRGGSGRVWLAYAPLEGSGWSLGAVIPEDEVLAPAWELARRQAILGGLGSLALVGLVWLLVLGLTRPLKRLAQGAARLAGGDLSTRVEGIRPGDEIGEVAGAFNGMVGELNRYIDELTTTTAAKQRIESELDMARQIQQSILPRTYPAFPDAPQFDLFATTVPAREVGGDFYDFFMLDEDRLGLVVGDVSGKGIPAALFMTVARTLVKNAASHYPDPARTLKEVNAQLLPDNEMCMFVTLFYGVYHLSTGVLSYVSAGHPPPLLRRAGGGAEQLPKSQGMALGVFEGMELELNHLNLGVGDTFLVYTDGLDEAVNHQEEMFGLERALAWLAAIRPGPAPELLADLQATQRAFTGEVEQFDDLTLLIFTRRE